MKIIERDAAVFAYDEDMNEVIIQLIEEEDGEERLFIGSKREWRNYAQNHSVVAL